MHIHFSIIVKHIEANGNDNVDMGWFKNQEIFVLVLEHELIDEGVLFKTFKSLCKFFHVEMATTVL